MIILKKGLIRLLFFVSLGLLGFSNSQAKNLKFGSEAPDFELSDLNGKTYRLSQFRGNFVFLNIWATWCPPCLEELPGMEALNELMKASSFTMIAISADQDLSEVQKFVKKLPKKLTFLVLHDPTGKVIHDAYGVEKFPETFWIDRQGKVLKKFEGAVDWLSSKKLSDLQGLASPKTIVVQKKLQ